MRLEHLSGKRVVEVGSRITGFSNRWLLSERGKLAVTWTDFCRQFDAAGRDKADGYSPFHFGGSSASELDHARTMLEERSAAGDTVDGDGLRLIGN